MSSPPQTQKSSTGLRVVFATAEFAPLVQTGGLGDAVAGLARALAHRGHEVRCLLPGHAGVLSRSDLPALREVAPVRLWLPGGEVRGRWLAGALGAVELEILDLPALFGAQAPYGGPDEALRFIAFARATGLRCAELAPDVLVAHDWHAALSICVLRTLFDTGRRRAVGTVQVVHNGAHAGRFPAGAMAATGLPQELFAPDGLEFHGDLCLLKGGLGWADRIVAVSPSYADELRRPEFGGGLDGLYRYRGHRLVGIANGIDTDRYDPARDALLPARFDADHPQRRAECRKAMLDELGLEPPPRGRLLTAVGRLADQKGWDVIVEALPALVEAGASIAMLGDGDPAIAERLERAVAVSPGRVVFRRGWDDAMARRLYAGSDCVLVPSRYEPCGLVQLLAQRYGALPIAHAVGGLRDTIEDGHTGVLFSPLSAKSLVAAVDRAVELIRRRGHLALTRNLLATDVSWADPASRWSTLLEEVAHEAAARI